MSGWGSWGSWISSTVSNVVDTSSKIVQELTNSADEENAELTNSHNNNTLRFYRTDEEIEEEKRKKEELQKELENESELERILLSSASAVVDGTFKTFDNVISSGTKFIQTIESANVSELVSKQIETTTNTAKGVIHTAKHLLNIDEDEEEGYDATHREISEPTFYQTNHQNDQNDQPNYINNNNNNNNNQRVGKDLEVAPVNNIEMPASFQRYFDEKLGNIHLQALELLSTECMMKTQETQRKCDKSILPSCVTYLQRIKEKFEDEEEDEDEDEDEDGSETKEDNNSFIFNNKVESIKKAINELEGKSQSTASRLLDEFKEQLLTFINSEHDGDEKDIADHISAISNQLLETLKNESLKVLAQHSSYCVELINRISENWLIDAKNSVSEIKDTDITSISPPETTLLKLTYLRTLSNSLADDISRISFPFVSASKELLTLLKEKFPNQNLEKIDELIKNSVNNIYLDTGDANSNIFNSIAFVVPILQWIYIIDEAKLSQVVEK